MADQIASFYAADDVAEDMLLAESHFADVWNDDNCEQNLGHLVKVATRARACVVDLGDGVK
jgi:hypothetical protein